MKTDTEDLLDSLKFSYIQYKACTSNDNAVNTAYTQGYCIALEDILEVHFGVTPNKIIEIRKSILGDNPLGRMYTEIPMDFLEIVEI
ncbi:hypothetical protein SMGD1_2057 [Sulfurimonas gotlandica GD1]|uniref:Phage protein n=1 Tax=Sulfurimonas gotlandica (strain DSM 19862 / JCM 16533 / GD1) TaxID=929558 RepID=B6BJ65_SULGG|nr:hypothetical protein [Sulfurimonas gotlandica]EDZ63308.1 hypothetical protein CBGD1_928 [Sulfurimonas gotlandica GD1]EHP30580.1 hypothetical protein SMGD1_2057 [Sulfurimonas gotlandica GD1]